MQTYLTIEINRGTARARSLPQGFQATKLWKWKSHAGLLSALLSAAPYAGPQRERSSFTATPPRLPELPRGLGGAPRNGPEPLQLESATRRGRIRSLLEHSFLWWVHQRLPKAHLKGLRARLRHSMLRSPRPFSCGQPCAGARGGAFPAPPALGSRPASPPFLPSFSILAALSLLESLEHGRWERESSCLGYAGKKSPLAFQKLPHSWGRCISIFRGPFSIHTPSSPCLDSTGLV